MNLSSIADTNGLFVDGDWIEKRNQDPNGEVRLIQLADIGEGVFKDKSARYITDEKAKELNCTFLRKGDILIARLGEPLCKACIFPLAGKFITAVDIAILRIGRKDVYSKYLVYLMNSPWFKEQTKEYESGTTRKRISRKNLGKIDIKLPSLEEQQRIVSKIEELFSSLDNAVETLNKTKDQLAVYRQAILKEAFDYRNSNDNVELLSIVDDIKIGPFGTMLHKSDYIDGGIPVINPKHIKNQEIFPSKKITVSKEKAEELKSYKVKENDVLMGRRGEMGRTAPVTKNEEGWICGTGSIIIRLKSNYDAVFYSQILASPDTVHYLEEKATGTTMNNLNEDIVKHIPVPNITYNEQKVIKEGLDAQISVCDKIKSTVDNALNQAEAMRQSILKEAFEGRLV